MHWCAGIRCWNLCQNPSVFWIVTIFIRFVTSHQRELRGCSPVAWARASPTPERGGAAGACSGTTARTRGSWACAVSASGAPLHPCSLRAGVGSAPALTGSPAARQRSARSLHFAEQMEGTQGGEDAVLTLIGTDTRGSDTKCAHSRADSVQVRSFIKPGSDKYMDDVTSWVRRRVVCAGLSIRGHISAPHVHNLSCNLTKCGWQLSGLRTAIIADIMISSHCALHKDSSGWSAGTQSLFTDQTACM